MSRKLTVVFLAMLVLVGAMSLKTVVVAHGDGTVIMLVRCLGRMAAHQHLQYLGRMAARRLLRCPGSSSTRPNKLTWRGPGRVER